MTSISNLSVTRGDTAKWDLTFSSRSGTGLVGATVRMTVKASTSDPDANAVIRLDNALLGGIVVTDAGNGVARITITAAQLSTFPAITQPYVYDIQVTEQDGTVTTLFKGTFTVSADVTQTS